MKLLLYCTKAKPYLYKNRTMLGENIITFEPFIKNKDDILNGKIIGECDFEVEEIKSSNLVSFEKESCIDRVSMLKYLKPNIIWNTKFEGLLKIFGSLTFGYAIHIKNLHIFDEPKELNDYSVYTPGVLYGGEYLVPLKNAPQNMMYCYEYVKTKSNGLTGMSNGHFVKEVIVSIRPEWLCKILNGEKTIEVRKKVLKEMIK